MQKRDKLSEEINKALKKAPVIEGFSVKELARITNTPWSTTRWHLESLESKGIVGHTKVGKASLYFLKKQPLKNRTRPAP